jgi:hypothetical protein
MPQSIAKIPLLGPKIAGIQGVLIGDPFFLKNFRNFHFLCSFYNAFKKGIS